MENNVIKRKVLFTSNNMQIGGMEKSLLALLNSFDFDKYEVTLLLEKKKGELLKQLNKKIIVEEYKLSTCRFTFFRRLSNFIKKNKWKNDNRNKYDFSCCYATYSRICNYLTRVASDNNLLYVHSNYFEYYNHNKNYVKELFDELHIRDFRKVAFVSNDAKQGILTVYPELKDNFEVIGNIFMYEHIDKLVKEKVKYVKPKNKTVFVFVGRLEEESKKITRLIKAFERVSKVREDFELLIVGDGENRNLYKSMIEERNLKKYIKMLGMQENPYPYYRLADYIMLVSNFEGFPVIYNEALYLNKTVLTTINISDSYINVEDDLAIILEKDYEFIADKIIDILKNKITKKIKKIDYKNINEGRVKKLYSLIDGVDNDKNL